MRSVGDAWGVYERNSDASQNRSARAHTDGDDVPKCFPRRQLCQANRWSAAAGRPFLGGNGSATAALRSRAPASDSARFTISQNFFIQLVDNWRRCVILKGTCGQDAPTLRAPNAASYCPTARLSCATPSRPVRHRGSANPAKAAAATATLCRVLRYRRTRQQPVLGPS